MIRKKMRLRFLRERGRSIGMSLSYCTTTTEEIKEKVNILELVSRDTRLTRKGSRYWGLCPFHLEKNPSFCIYPDTRSFYCFSCHTGGDVFDFVMQRDHISFKEAKELLASYVGLTPHPSPGAGKKQQREQEEQIATELTRIQDAELARLIAIEKWCYLITKHIYLERDLNRPVVIWALRTKDRLGSLIDILLDGSPGEKLQAAYEAGRIELWENI